MNKKPNVFTPLRVALMVAVVLANVMALVAYLNPSAAWSEPLGIYAVVFILLFVFVILLELVWMLNMRKVQTDSQVRSQYNKALGIYGFFFVLGFVEVYLVLMG
ncbi:hypothetical protein [Marinicella rhabdoformis]|uniref:hypothetical protein n=1 Tax=Marinicella rhabdoformis TaxID=2580566 RepID=UPI0012AEDA7A|nr:hypothetical protein [Marinicella rhabdoformis]